jgi:hypothetical protein
MAEGRGKGRRVSVDVADDLFVLVRGGLEVGNWRLWLAVEEATVPEMEHAQRLLIVA